MNHQHILKQFIMFLKKEQVYECYLKLLKNGADYRNKVTKSNMDESKWLAETSKTQPQRLIIDSFRWPLQVQGFISWVCIDNKWRKYIKDYYINLT